MSATVITLQDLLRASRGHGSAREATLREASAELRKWFEVLSQETRFAAPGGVVWLAYGAFAGEPS